MLNDILHQILGNDIRTSLLIIMNLILIESLLSIDNAAVLATMVMDLPPKQRARALRIGIVFAYIFRGLCLFFAAILIKITWLKLVGALYLLYLCFNFFVKKHENEEHHHKKNENKLFKMLNPFLGPFWSTVVMVEIMDLVFSIDNVFAAVVYAKDNIYLIWIGVFIGIITMRLVATVFVRLMEKFPLLNTAAFVVIGMLGTKLLLAFLSSVLFLPGLTELMENQHADFIFSLSTLVIFCLPLLVGRFKKKTTNKV